MNKCLSNLSLIVITLLLSSCGYDTRDWPRPSFTFSYEDVVETNLYFHQKATRYTEELEDSIVSEDKLFAKRVIDTVTAYPYREKKERTLDTKNYYLILDIQFTYFDDCVEKIEKITFYEYDIADGKVVLNNGEIHFLPGTVRGAYDSIVDKESKQ